ncbi:UbiD family decarboxylase [Halalkalibacter oceani]|uniref:UbiD family decarboxylase n=1 Tax=Halalkalibacter oceani TaxID=1653776 RepID=UPI003392E0FC
MIKKQEGNPLDLRHWLEEIEAEGELTKVDGADWNLEIGAISELNVKKAQNSALLFDQIIGYREGFRVLTCSTSSPKRLASILRLDVDSTHKSLVTGLRGKPKQWEKESVDYEPVYTEEGPIFENVQSGEEVDLFTFPSPLWHEKDGGRYIGTGCSVVTKDYDSDWINVGTYRVMIHDKNHVGLDMVPGKHGHIQYEKYEKAGKPFPVAIVIGADPLHYLISGIEVPFGKCEYHYIGSILKEPVSVVQTQLTGLPVPSASEIVIEGWIHPGETKIEGPFGEFHGYYPAAASPAPVVKIERIYYRDNPIIMGSPPAKPPNDYSYSKAVMRSALLFDAVEAAGIPDVKGVWAHEIGGSRMFTVISIKQRYAGHARQAGHVLSQCGVGSYLGRYSIVVDEDIDPANLAEVMWAVSTRTDPELDIDIIKRAMGSKNDPMKIAYPYKAPFSSRAIIDACRPYDYINEFPEVAEASKELQESTLKKWAHLF